MKKAIFIISIITLFFVGCKKDDIAEASKLRIETETIEKGWDYVKINVEYDYPVELEAVTLYLSEKEDISGAEAYECKVEGNKFSVEVEGLKEGVGYYYCYEYDNGYEKEKGEKQNINTVSKPVVITKEVSDVNTVSATLNGSVTNNDAINEISEMGFCWDTKQNPTIEGSHYNKGGMSGTGTSGFSYNLTSLVDNKTYYVRTYAKTNYGTIYGEEKSFTTVEIVLPTVTTNTVTNIKATTATCGGNVTSDGNGIITARGICWSTSPNPTIEDNKTTDGSGTGSFTSYMSGLKDGTTYYVRAYATNEVGTAYGEEKSFTTIEIVLPTVATNSVTNIKTTTATCGGNVTSDGNGIITARGICWSTSQNPTIEDNKTTDGGGTGSFTSDMSGLKDGTTYYVRAYATNEVGTAYGEEKSFTTIEIVLPTVATNSVTDIKTTTATCGGNVMSDGNSTVTARGICWSTSPNPTIEKDNKINNGSGTGSFTSYMSGLKDGTTYYVRAYATNEKGTSYGEEKTFTTVEIVLPTVTTNTVTNIKATTAICGGNVTSDGNGIITARGICWSTSQNPTIEDNKTTDGSGTGSFTSYMSGLKDGTTYYVRAYATNEVGTAYGEEKSFTTIKVFEETVDTDGNSIMTLNGNVIFKMIAVEGGTFQMGATSEQGSDAGSDESPVHDVTLSSYYISETEVTQELWEAVMGSNPSYFSGSQKPVEQISWYDCQEFITKLNELTGENFRLPTEAEWEYAARGGNKSRGYMYSGSNTIGNVAWYDDNSSSTHDVKTKQANELGIYDMSGNVWEWCQDWYGSYSSGSQTNPTGPTSGSYRVLRGGCWGGYSGNCCVSCRTGTDPGYGYKYGGFRLILQ